MSAGKFNPDARTPQELLENVEFQFNNVQGWLRAVQDFPGESGSLCAAMLKAKCLVEAAQVLHAKLEAEYRALPKVDGAVPLKEVFKQPEVGA